MQEDQLNETNRQSSAAPQAFILAYASGMIIRCWDNRRGLVYLAGFTELLLWRVYRSRSESKLRRRLFSSGDAAYEETLDSER